MNPISHLLISWSVAGLQPTKKERAAVTLAGIIPDVDGLGIIAEKLTMDSETPLLWYAKYHHVLGHNIFAALIVSVACFFIAGRKIKTAVLAFIVFHIHILCDVAGSRGPDDSQWEIPYLYPFSDAWLLAWEGQWAFNAWQNVVITLAALAMMFYIVIKKGRSPLEMVSAKAESKFVDTILKRFKIKDGKSAD